MRKSAGCLTIFSFSKIGQPTSALNQKERIILNHYSNWIISGHNDTILQLENQLNYKSKCMHVCMLTNSTFVIAGYVGIETRVARTHVM